jgi:hypothetical protein
VRLEEDLKTTIADMEHALDDSRGRKPKEKLKGATDSGFAKA